MYTSFPRVDCASEYTPAIDERVMPDAPGVGGPDAGPFVPEEAAGAEAQPASVDVEYTAITSVQRINDIQFLQARPTVVSQ